MNNMFVPPGEIEPQAKKQDITRVEKILELQSPQNIDSLLCPMRHWDDPQESYAKTLSSVRDFMTLHPDTLIHTEGVIFDDLFDATESYDVDNQSTWTLEAALKQLLVNIEAKAENFQQDQLDTRLKQEFPTAIRDTDISFRELVGEVKEQASLLAEAEDMTAQTLIEDVRQYVQIQSRLDPEVKQLVAERFPEEGYRKIIRRIINRSTITFRNATIRDAIMKSNGPGVFIYGGKHFEKIVPELIEAGYKIK